MKILLVGGGGREHALAWKLAQSPRVEKIYCAPGNGGTANFCENTGIGMMDVESIVQFAKSQRVDLAVVAPDDSLAAGLVDALQKAGVRSWGPVKAAAQVESSKAFAKELMKEQGIPTAGFGAFASFEDAAAYVKSQPLPIVVKASGLALGKGVAVCNTIEEAESFLKQIFVDKIFGEAGKEVIVEEFLEGQEVSFHAFSDGESYSLFPASQDHKAIFDGDQGPNTGGMGTIAPVPWVNSSLIEQVKKEVVEPALKGLKEKGSAFMGVLYPGVIVTKNGPKVLEFNARFGDPETQSYMRLLKTDLLDILEASIEGRLADINIEWNDGYAATVVLASNGYPGKYDKGKEITGIEEAEKLPGVVVFHAGTIYENNKLVTSGGRVLHVTATGETLKETLNKAYSAVRLINFEGMQYRTDIGAKSL